jgi:hypothetical protein
MSEMRENTSSDILSLPLKDVPIDIIDPSDWLTWDISDVTKQFWGDIVSLGKFFDEYFQKNSIDEKSIIGYSFSHPLLILTQKDGENIEIDMSQYADYGVRQVLGKVTVNDQETKVWQIHAAIESIYCENEWLLWNGEIDDTSTVKSGEYSGKNLAELKALLDVEQAKLYAVYDIQKISGEKIALLKREIEIFAWVGDKYEWGAQYFSESSAEIHSKVRILTESMSVEEIFAYIAEVNTHIDGNWKKSDMVSQVNAKLLRALYENYFERLKNENKPNRDFIEFAKLITGRKEERLTSKNRDGTEIPLDAEFDESLAQYDIVNEVLLYVMNREGGVMDEIMKAQKDFEFGDPEVQDKAPSSVAKNMLSELQKLHPENPKIADELFKEASFDIFLGTKKSYKELSFDEKIQIGALYRVTQKLKSSSPESLQNPNFVSSFIQEEMVHAFTTVKESFDDEFDGYNLNLRIASPNFFGYSASKLWLTGEFGEIFDLYQDINGNFGFWNFHDETLNNITNIGTVTVLGMWIIAGIVILSPLFAAGAFPGAIGLMIAGAQIWAVTGATNLLVSRQGYDSYEEAIFDSAAQFSLEVGSSALFTTGAGIALQKMGHTLLSTDFAFSKKAWGKAGFTDKTFTGGEVSSWMILNGATNSWRKTIFTENHFDTDQSNYHTEIKKKTQQPPQDNPIVAGDTDFWLF